MSQTLCIVGGYPLNNDECELMESTAFILMLEFQKANQFCEGKVVLKDKLVSKKRWNPSDILV